MLGRAGLPTLVLGDLHKPIVKFALGLLAVDERAQVLERARDVLARLPHRFAIRVAAFRFLVRRAEVGEADQLARRLLRLVRAEDEARHHI